MSRPKYYTDSELREVANEIETDFPNVAEGLRVIAHNKEPDLSPDSSELEESEHQLLSVVKEVDDLQTPDDYAYRISNNNEELANQFPELTEDGSVEELLNMLVRKRFIAKLVSPGKSDSRLYGTFNAVLPRVEIGDTSHHGNPGFRWKPEFLVEGANQMEIDVNELTVRVHRHPRQGLHLPPIENQR